MNYLTGIFLVVDKVLWESIMHELLGLVFHVCSDEGSQIQGCFWRSVAAATGLDTDHRRELTIAIQGQIILDQTIRNVPGHFPLWHGMLGEVLGGERGAIDRCVDGVGKVVRNEG